MIYYLQMVRQGLARNFKKRIRKYLTSSSPSDIINTWYYINQLKNIKWRI